MRLIPSIDLRDGRVVRLLRGAFDAETRYPTTPAAVGARYRALGATRLHVVDLDGARDGTPRHLDAIGELAGLGFELQVGGGLRDRARIEAVLAAGATRAVIGSACVTHPERVQQWLEHFGVSRLVLALDVRVRDGIPEVLVHGWTESSRRSLWDVLEPLSPWQGLEVLCTDVARDGALGGPSVALYAEAVSRAPTVRWQASGGVRHGADLAALAAVGCAAAISGKALLEGTLTDEEARPFLRDA